MISVNFNSFISYSYLILHSLLIMQNEDILNDLNELDSYSDDENGDLNQI